MLSILKNLKKVSGHVAVAVVASSLVPSVGFARGGMGGGGGFHPQVMHVQQMQPARLQTVQKFTQPVKLQTMQQTFTLPTTSLGSIVNKPGSTVSNKNPINLGSIFTKPGNVATTPVTTTVPSKNPINLGSIFTNPGNIATTPVTTTVPSKNPINLGSIFTKPGSGTVFNPPISTTPPTGKPPVVTPPVVSVPPVVSLPPVVSNPPVSIPPTTPPTTPPTMPPSCPPSTTGSGGGLFPIPFPIGGFGGGYGGGYGGYGGYSGGAVASAPVMASAPAAAPSDAVVPASYVAATGSVDLVLEDIHMAEPATLVAGPAYRVKFRNQGLAAAGAFRVGVIAAVDGQASQSQAIAEVPGLPAGQTAEVTLRLPQSALKLASTSGSGFTQLGVVVDLDKSVVESDKTNNAALVDRSTLEASH